MLYALIVIYNKYCCDSLSFEFIEKYKDKINFILFDNSTLDYGNSTYCKKNGITYYSLNENVGLSIAYNYVIDRIKLSKNNYLMILDDDTILNDSYIKEILYEVEKSVYDILLPVVNADNKIISPSNVSFDCRVRMVNNSKDVNIKKITGINSGMVVRTSVYNYVKYDESIFLDYVDHDFMRKIRKNQFEIKVMNSIINQNYSRFQKSDNDREINRFKIFLKDYKFYCKKCHRRLFYYFSTFKYRMSKFLKYKKIVFLTIK